MSYTLYPTYPYPELPRPERQGFDYVPGEAGREFDPDAGPVLRRPRFSAVADTVTWPTWLTARQRGRFWRFYGEETPDRIFRVIDPTRHQWPLLAADGRPVRTGAGAPLLVAAYWLVQWGRPPREVPKGNGWLITMDLVVLPR